LLIYLFFLELKTLKLPYRLISSYISNFCAILLDVPKSIIFVKGSQVSPACPSDKSSVKVKINMKFWSNVTEKEKTDVHGEKPGPVPRYPTETSP